MDGLAPAEQSLLNKLIRKSLVMTREQMEILQADPASPMFSVKTFEELRLNPELLRGVYSMGFNRPSRIQESALPMMLAYPKQGFAINMVDSRHCMDVIQQIEMHFKRRIAKVDANDLDQMESLMS